MLRERKPDGLTPNADGLYLLSDIDARMAETMAKYETLEDLPNTVQPTLYSKEEQEPTRIYNLQGQRLNTVPQSGVYIQGREKKVAR
ncbi:MAG: hypothetical protein IKO62_08430 [Bacteroidales bacterium]|nr:hypothetical protein [Bacteroidales bacterium]